MLPNNLRAWCSRSTLPASLRCLIRWPVTAFAPAQADCLPDPGDVFAFLRENGIGQEHALFYVAHATYLEVRACLPACWWPSPAAAAGTPGSAVLGTR